MGGIRIFNLPETDIITDTDYMIVEREEGTRKIKSSKIKEMSNVAISTLDTKVNKNDTDTKKSISTISSQLADIANTGTTIEAVQNKVEDMAKKGLIQAYTLGDGTLEPKKTTFFDTGKNFFNKQDGLNGYYLRHTDGVPLASASWFTSNFIRVDASTDYSVSHSYRLAFYDTNKAYISGFSLIGTSQSTFKTPQNTAYMRCDVNISNIDYFQLEKGLSKTTYEKYYTVIPNSLTEKHIFDIVDIPDKAITNEKLSDEVVSRIKLRNIIKNGNFENIDNWLFSLASGATLNNEVTFTATNRLGSVYQTLGNCKANNKYYVMANVKASTKEVGLQFYRADTGSSFNTVNHTGNGQYEKLSFIFTPTLEINTRVRVIDYATSGWQEIKVKEFLVVNLTDTFGVGKEPSIDEVENMIKGSNMDNIFFNNELVTNLIDCQLLNPSTNNNDHILPLYISYENERLDVISKYNATSDLRVRMEKKGANNLFDFFGFYLIPNTTQITSPSPSSGDTLFGVGTDFFGPYQISSINDIDGDYTTGTQFTGGNHGYDGGSTGSATARTTKIKMMVDGRSVTDFKGYASYIDIYWQNRIQASNTKKIDGTGREVLQENIHLHFDGNKWSVENIIEILEDVKWGVYYGLQAQLSAYNGFAFYHNSNNRKWNIATLQSDSESKECDKVTLYKNENWMDLEMDNTGLGKKILNTNNEKGAFISSAGKVYFNLVNSGTTTVNKGDVFSFNGAYRFYSK